MSSKPAIALQASSVTSGPSVDSIVNQMQGLTISEGWDVICALSIGQINSLFAAQYVQNLSEGDQLPPISDKVPVIGSISVQFSEVTLGPPLVSFSPANEPQELNLTVPFLSGSVLTISSSGSVENVLSVQPISESLGYTLSGTVPLKSIAGKVENSHDVVIDILNGKAFSANLQVTGGAETVLGQYFLSWLQKHLDKFQYKLGTLIYGNENLAPAGEFLFATQQNAQDPNDAGRLLLFIPTTYNPKGGAQTSISIPNIVPAGYSATLIVSSQVLFTNVIGGFYNQLLSQFNASITASQTKSGGNYTLAISNGTLTIPVIETTYSGGYGNYDTFSGTASAPWNTDKQPVSFPINGITVEPSNNSLKISCNNPWSQNFASVISVPRSEGYVESGSVNLNTSLSCQTTTSVDPTADTVSFNGKTNVSVTFNEVGIWGQIFGNGDASNYVGGQITGAAQPALEKLFSINLPTVNAFAVSNLLFPGMNILSFGEAFVPGDLIIFGTIEAPPVAITPVAVSLGPSETQQFTATNADNSAVKWSAIYGSVTQSGLYTAPGARKSVTDSVIATSSSNSNHQAAAVVSVFRAAVEISPSFAQTVANGAALQFSATSLESGNITWSISPQVGSIDSSGKYTPPASVQSPQAITITASNGKATGSALVVVFGTQPTDVAVTPAFVTTPIAPGATQQFSAAVGGVSNPSVTWSVLPADAGTITPQGLYTAPANVTQPQSVLIVATDSISVLFGTAWVEIAPPAM